MSDFGVVGKISRKEKVEKKKVSATCLAYARYTRSEEMVMYFYFLIVELQLPIAS